MDNRYGYWSKKWQQGDDDFIVTTQNRLLEDWEYLAFEGRPSSVFVPLCGKSPDMYWFYRKGHTVFGVEFVEKAILEFFTEFRLEFVVDHIRDKGKVFQSLDGRLKIYCMDLFLITRDMVGHVDVIYDSHSIVAIDYSAHEPYIALMKTLMKENTKYILMTAEMGIPIAPWADPHSVSNERVHWLIGDKYFVDIIHEEKYCICDTRPSDGDGEDPASVVQRSGYPNTVCKSPVGTTCRIDRWYLIRAKLT